jgi:hypothetical protein
VYIFSSHDCHSHIRELCGKFLIPTGVNLKLKSCSDKSGTILFFQCIVGNISMDFLLPEQIADFIYLCIYNVKVDK